MKAAGSVFGLVLLTSLLTWADGMIIPYPGFHPPRPVPSMKEIFEIKYHNVTTEINDQKAEVSIDQKFRNPNSYRIEAMYIFPLPNNAAINSMAVTVNDKLYTAELLQADKAKEIYESYVRKQKDPALLEYIGNGLYKTRMFPFEPHKELVVKVGYQELLTRKEKTVKWLYPLNTEKFSSTPLEQVSVTARIKSKHAIGSVYSPTHDLKVTRVSEHEVLCEYSQKNIKPTEDFIIYYTISESDQLDHLLLSSLDKENNKEGYFLLLVNPDLWARKHDIPYIPKDIIFVIDKSGSMQGKKIEQARNALKYVLRNLNDKDYFSIIAYDDKVMDFLPEHIQATESNVAKGLAYADNVDANGGTDLNGAVQRALARINTLDKNRPKYIMFLTDGLPTVGETDVQKIIKSTAATVTARTRIFTFGVGYDVNTKLLDKIAMDSRGLPFYVSEKEDIEKSVSDLYSSIQNPVLTGIEISFSGQTITYTYPDSLPDLFKNSQLLLAGKYAPGGDSTLTIKGTFIGKPKTMTYPVTFNKTVTGDYQFLGRLWAQRRIGFLTDQIRKNGSSKELVDEITQLGLRFGIVTEHTSFLITEETQPRAVYSARMGGRAMKLAEASSVGFDSFNVSRDLQRQQKAGSMAENAYYFDSRGKKVEVRSQVQFVGGRAFYNRTGSQWVDSRYDTTQSVVTVELNSPEYFKLMSESMDNNAVMSLGQNVIFVHKNQAYEVVTR
jgi:Ca-activated chloride channel family protein